VLFFPITTKQPERDRFAFEIPAIEKRRAGLDADRHLWIIMDKFNSDVIGPLVLSRTGAANWPVQQGLLPADTARIHRAP